MYQVITTQIEPNTTHYRISKDGEALSTQAWINTLRNDRSGLEFFVDILRNSPYEAYFWELRPVTATTIAEDVEFVLVESKSLARITANSRDFQEHFVTEEEVVAFPNLRGDAQLVVPTPQSDASAYGHLAAFVRQAPPEQVHAFWQRVSEEYQQAIGAAPKWLSTSGLGVYWLHVRIDSRPKYYQHRAFRQWPLLSE